MFLLEKKGKKTPVRIKLLCHFWFLLTSRFAFLVCLFFVVAAVVVVFISLFMFFLWLHLLTDDTRNKKTKYFDCFLQIEKKVLRCFTWKFQPEKESDLSNFTDLEETQFRHLSMT